MAGPSIVESLIESRQVLLMSALPCFEAGQPSHRLTEVATVKLNIGPHAFTARLFRVDWAPTRIPRPLAPGALPPNLSRKLDELCEQDPLLKEVRRKAAKGLASPEETLGLANFIEAMSQHEAQVNPASSQSSNPDDFVAHQATPSIVIEFTESPTKRFLIPSHFACDFAPEGSSRTPFVLGQWSIILSFFVPPPDESTGGPVPFDIIIENLDDTVRGVIYEASRSAKPEDEEVETWVRQQIRQVEPRFIVRNPTPPPEPVEDLDEVPTQAMINAIKNGKRKSAGSSSRNRKRAPRRRPSKLSYESIEEEGPRKPRASAVRALEAARVFLADDDLDDLPEDGDSEAFELEPEQDD